MTASSRFASSDTRIPRSISPHCSPHCARSLRTLISQQVLTNLFVGIAQGARAASAFDDAWQRRASLDAGNRARVAFATSEAKIVAYRAALDIGEKLFDACGARASHAPLALDRFWRNARVHTLHDPLDYRVHDVGR
ncbi:alkylation response protein AidB-like acyl-CoA dehydrogenase [Paraburkholderia sp. UCT70]